VTADYLPDFLIIGRPKSGSTSVARWLADQPEVWFSSVKEPRFFNRQDQWERGLDWYRSLFHGARDGQLLGEATVGYTNPHIAAVAAERIVSTVPDCRLIYLIRHPADQIRSAYRHLRTFRTEPGASLAEALTRPGSDYVAHAMYYTCLAPYLDRFDREQILVVRMEDVVGPGGGWDAIIGHLGLSARPRPDGAFNVSSEKGLQSRMQRVVGALDAGGLRSRLPSGVRRIGRRLMWRRGARFRRMLDASRGPIPEGVLEPVWQDITRLEQWLGRSEPLWPDRVASTAERPLPSF
jgi:hypothetical protein